MYPADVLPGERSLAPLAAAFAPRERQASAPLWWVTFRECRSPGRSSRGSCAPKERALCGATVREPLHALRPYWHGAPPWLQACPTWLHVACIGRQYEHFESPTRYPAGGLSDSNGATIFKTLFGPPGFRRLLGERFRREWDSHLYVASRNGHIDGGSNFFKVKANTGPLLVGQHHDGNLPVVQVLLIADVPVGAQKQIVTSFFSALDQNPVSQLVPAQLGGSGYLMPDEASRRWIAVCRDRTRSSRHQHRLFFKTLGSEMEHRLHLIKRYVKFFGDLLGGHPGL